MKKPEDIKKGLECCGKDDFCASGACPYHEDCYVNHAVYDLERDAFTYIQQLETDNAEKDKRIAELEQELAAANQERDAAVSDMKQAQGCICTICKNHYRPDPTVRRYECKIIGNFSEILGSDDYRPIFCGKFEWRGVCPGNTEVKEDG